MNNDLTDDDFLVLVDLREAGLKQVSIKELTAEKLMQASAQSKKVVQNGLETISWVAQQAKIALDDLHDKPDEAEVEFLVKLTSSAAMLVMQAQSEFHLKVRLVWKRKQDVNESQSDVR